MSDQSPSQKIPSAAQGFGYVGLVPLIAGAIAVWTSVAADVRPVAEAMLFYSAVVLSFLGGIRWGLALDNPRSANMAVSLTVGIFPPLVAWIMLLIGMSTHLGWGLLGTAVAYALMYFSDLLATKEGTAPPWYPTLRLPLTIAADIALLAILARVMTYE